MNVFIYALVDPRTLLIRYVGQTRVGMRRPESHNRRSNRSHNTYTSNWLLSLHKAGLAATIVILQISTKPSLDTDEIWWIAFGRACGWPLTNHTDGGSGITDDTIRRMSESNRGISTETRQRQVQTRKANGWIVTDATRAKISATLSGVALTSATKLKMSEVHQRRLGTLLTPEQFDHIKKLKEDGHTQRSIAKALGLTSSLVHRILSGKKTQVLK